MVLAGNINAAAQKAVQLCEKGSHVAQHHDSQSVINYVRRMPADACSKPAEQEGCVADIDQLKPFPSTGGNDRLGQERP